MLDLREPWFDHQLLVFNRNLMWNFFKKYIIVGLSLILRVSNIPFITECIALHYEDHLGTEDTLYLYKDFDCVGSSLTKLLLD